MKIINLYHIRTLIEHKIKEIIASNKSSSTLKQAIDYSLLSSGKKIRGTMAFCVSVMFDANQNDALLLATAIEVIHAYSLIHDDLPAIDNSDTRRNMPSCHKKFGEATAIITGDALLTMTFELLSKEMTQTDYKTKCRLIFIISHAAGQQGMISGQAMDIVNKNKKISVRQALKINTLKTAKLFIAACEAGAVLGNANQQEISKIKKFAYNFGLAFQIIDDLDDLDSKIEKLLSKKILQRLIHKAQDAINILNIPKAKQNLHNLLLELLNQTVQKIN